MRTFNLVKSLTKVINTTSLPFREGLGVGRLILCLSLVTLGINDAWGKYKANVTVKSSPTSGGYVYVGTSNSCGEGNCTKSEDDASQTGGGTFATSGNVTLYLCHKNANNYIFKGWSTSNTSNSGEGATSNPYSKSFAGSASTFGGKDYTYYAIFARMTADISSKDFGNVNVEQSSSATTITVTHAHASKITAALSGTNSGDFSLSNTTIVDNSVSEGTATFTVTFKPTCNGTREATLTLSSTNGLSNVTISLSGTGVLNGQSLSWNNESTIELNMLNGATQNISATATSGLAVSYSSSNSDVLSVDATGKLTAKSVGEATITVSQLGDGCTYSAATSISKTFNVKSKDTPIFTPNWSSTDIKVGDKVTLGVQYVSDGLSGDFKAKDYNSDILKVTREGNTITIEALNAGNSGVTFSQTENSGIFAASKTYSFTVTRIANTLAVDATHTMKVDEEWMNVITTNSNAEISTESSDETLAYYDVANNKIIARNTENKSFDSKEVTITISQANTYKYAEAEKTIKVTVNKWANPITCKFEGMAADSKTIAYNSSTTVQFSSSINDLPFVVEQNPVQDLVAYDESSKKFTSTNAAGTTTWKVSQDENYKYAKSEKTFTVVVSKPNNHVPLTYNSNLYSLSSVTTNKHGTVSFSGTTLTLGDKNGGGFNHNDKYVIIHFEGTPDKLTFKNNVATVVGLLSVTGCEWFVKESPTGDFSSDDCASNDADLAEGGYISYDGTSEASLTIQLKPTTRWIKLCYSGNFAGYIKDIVISELSYMKKPEPASKDFGSEAIGEGNNATQDFVINWCNIAPVTITNTDPTHFKVDLTSFGGFDDIGSKTLSVTYDRSVGVGEHSAEIQIKNATHTQTIELQGKTTKKSQAIQWHPDLVSSNYALNKDIAYPNEELSYIAKVADGEVTFESANSDIIEVSPDGKQLWAKAVGKCNITVKYDGTSTEYLSVEETKEFIVSSAIRQTITWNQNLLGLTLGGSNVELNASASSGGNVTYVVTGVQGDNGVISVSDNTLTILGAGEAYVTAQQAGGIIGSEEYTSASMTKRVLVRDPTAACEDMILAGESCDINSTTTREYSIDGIPTNSLNFSAYHDKKSGGFIGIGVTYSTLMVKEYAYIDNLWQWHVIFNQVVAESSAANYSAQVSESATKIRFSSNETATHHISNVVLRRCKIVKSDVATLTASADCNALYQKTITINHSNVDVLTISVPDGFNVSKTTIGEGCGHYGEESFVFSFTPTEKKIYSGTITLTDGKSIPTTLEIPFSIESKAATQTIIDFTTEAMTIEAMDDVTFEGKVLSGNPVYYTSSDESVAYMDGAHLVVLKGGATVTVTAHCDADSKHQAAPDIAKVITINKVQSTITTAPSISVSSRSTTLADVTLVDGSASCEGTFAWTDPTTALQVGTNAYNVTFTPNNEDIFIGTDVDVSVTYNSETQHIAWDLASYSCYVGQTITFDAESQNTNGVATGLVVVYTSDDESVATIDGNTLTALSAGTVVVTASQSGDLTYTAADNVQKTITILSNTFTGAVDKDWNKAENWAANQLPVEMTPIIIDGNLDVIGELTVTSITIESGASVTIKNGATLTIKGSSAGRETYGDIIIENGGKLVIEETSDSVCAQNVYLSTSFGEHSSSQVIAAEHLSVHGDAFFDITWADNANAQKWHAFTVPFPVDARNGIYDSNNNPLTNEVNYAIMSYHGDVRAQGKYGWAKFRNIMTPGTFYLMTVDGTIPTFRFRKTTGSDLAATNLLQVAQFPKSSDAQITDAGWNGIGNSQLYYVSVDAPVQVLNPESYTYELKNANEYNFTVGTPFFYQASADGSVVLNEANGSNPAYAPARVGAAEIKDVNVMLSNNNYTDHLYLSATDEATAEYQIGRDLVKMTMTATPSVPQIFALAYNTALCMVDAPMTNDEAQVSVRLYAPASGEYTLSVSNAAAAEVYLLRNGMPVWNLSGSAYTLDLEKGNTEGYSLRLRRAHKQTTDMDAVNGSDKGGVQKVIMDNQLYILRGGQIYTVTGQIR